MSKEQPYEMASQTLIEGEKAREESTKVKMQFIASGSDRASLRMPERIWNEEAMREIEQAETKEEEK